MNLSLYTVKLGKLFELSLEVDGPMNCTFTIQDDYFKLLIFYLHEDVSYS